MTIIAFAEDKNNYFLATDSQVNMGSFKLLNAEKVQKFNNYYFASAGYAIISSELSLMKKDLPKTIKCIGDIEFFRSFIYDVIDSLGMVSAVSEEESHPIYEFDSVIVSPSGAWRINSELSISKISGHEGNFVAIGSGLESSHGAFNALRRRKVSIKDSLLTSVDVAKDFNTGCGGKTKFVTVKKAK
jgi:ATP-dependent protease HslVU (ClpYQ) peptidase subunit